MTEPVRRIFARRSGDDAGFTLMELIVAMVIISVVLIGLVGLQTSAMVTVTHAKQREQATAVANQVLEQLRAMPWATLSKGLNPSFASAAGGDPNVSGAMLHPSAQPAINEVLKTDSSQLTTVPPLSGAGGTNLSSFTDSATRGITYNARSYVTTPPSATAGILQLTVIVTWSEIARNGHTRSTVARTQVYSPVGGCGDAATQPFLGACEAQLSASSAAQPVTIGVTGADPATGVSAPTLEVIPGSGIYSASVSLGGTSSTTTSQQATSTVAVTKFPGATTASASGPLSSSGGTSVRAGASTDTGAANADPPNAGPTSATGTATSLAAVGTSGSLTLVPTSGAVGVTSAATTVGCGGVAAANQPCNTATVSGGSAATGLVLNAGGTNLQLVSAGAAPAGSAWSARFISTGGAGATGCTSLTGAGCAASGAARSSVSATVGPTSGSTTNGLVQVTGYSDSIRSELGASQLNVSPTASRSASVSYWTGTGYSTPVTITASTTLSVAGDSHYAGGPPTGPLTASWTAADGSVVTAVGSVSISPTVVTRVATDPSCVVSACRLTSTQPSVTVSVVYHVSNAALGVGYSFIVTTDLGSSRSTVEYKAAPSA